MARAILNGFLGVLALSGALLAPAAHAEGVGDYVLDSSRAAGLDSCVEPTETMRRFHMELIEHQRDTTVYGGIRGTKHSLAGCIECHVGYDQSQKPVPVNADGQFCNKCHEYAAVKLNCFDCHATIPEGEGWNHETATRHARFAHAASPRLAGAAPAQSSAARPSITGRGEGKE